MRAIYNILVLHIPFYIRQFGPIMGHWSMVFERLLCGLKRICKTPKNYQKQLVMEYHKREHLHQYILDHPCYSHLKLEKNDNPFEFANDRDDSQILLIGKASKLKEDTDKVQRKAIFSHFRKEMKQKFPNLFDSYIVDCDLQQAEIESFKKIQCGNIAVSIKNKNTTDDSYVHLKNASSPKYCSRFFEADDEMPLFASCLGIFPIKPFFRGPFKNNVNSTFYAPLVLP